ncbi:polyprenyl synthetase family protein [Amycolatopsis sp. NPDC059021]|uniref:polyprenyl synthetase family protein n=1 Tax=Amycolatopsis sp. NPDC059021 TaxID=3346704 RepID=UPI00366AD761
MSTTHPMKHPAYELTHNADRHTETIDTDAVRTRVNEVLLAFLDGKRREAEAAGHPRDLVEAVRGLVTAGGKRVRPLLCVVGWHAAGGDGDPGVVLRVAAAVEMWMTYALIHDDIIDDSETRRGRPTAQRAFAERFTAVRDAARYGASAALLAGDLALGWAAELLHGAALGETRQRVAGVFRVMLDEMVLGQYRDLLGAAVLSDDVDTALQTVRFKTAAGTATRPLQLGAATAGATDLERFAAFGMLLGEAYQLRDDLLGVFGRSAETGKPVLDDLREGKGTVLLAAALRAASGPQRALLESLVGRPGLTENDADRIRSVLVDTGARDRVERMIRDRAEQAAVLIDAAGFPGHAAEALHRLADRATQRTS